MTDQKAIFSKTKNELPPVNSAISCIKYIINGSYRYVYIKNLH